MTAAQLATKMQQRFAAIEPEFKKSTQDLGRTALRRSKELMRSEIYGPDVDRTKTGKPKWKRTHLLLRNEKLEFPDAYTVALVNETPYAEPRHEAGKPGRRKINPLRQSHWRDEVVADLASAVLDARSLTVRDILKG